MYNNSVDQDESDDSSISPYDICDVNCSYYEPGKLGLFSADKDINGSFFHLNCQGLVNHWDNFLSLLCDIQSEKFTFDVIGLSELFKIDGHNLDLPGYHSILGNTRRDCNRGGVGLYITNEKNYVVRDDLSIFIPNIFESLFVEIKNEHESNIIVGVLYRPNTAPKADLNIFVATFVELLDIINIERKQCVIKGDFNIDLLKYSEHGITNDFVNNVFNKSLIPVIIKPIGVDKWNRSNDFVNNVFNKSLIPVIIKPIGVDKWNRSYVHKLCYQ